jgi:hypothetical protein
MPAYFILCLQKIIHNKSKRYVCLERKSVYDNIHPELIRTLTDLKLNK